MAFTASDRLAVEQAMVTAAVDGVASVTVAGQSVTARSLDELRRLLEMITAELAVTNSLGSGGIRTRQLVPPGCG
jgi:hypothetical protein